MANADAQERVGLVQLARQNEVGREFPGHEVGDERQAPLARLPVR
jgi:hypothetical protein